MTDTTAEPTGPQPADSVPDEQTPDTNAGEAQTGNREAAKYRKALRATEAERDGLRDKVTSFERAEVERAAAQHFTDPADLWTAGVDIDELRGADGSVDAAKVAAKVAEVLAAHPHWQRARRGHVPARGLKSGASGSGDTTGTSWSSAFAQARGD